MVTAVRRHGAGRTVVHVRLCVVVLCSGVVVIRSEGVYRVSLVLCSGVVVIRSEGVYRVSSVFRCGGDPI